MTFQFYSAMREDVLTFWYCVPGPNIASQFYPAIRGCEFTYEIFQSRPAKGGE